MRNVAWQLRDGDEIADMDVVRSPPPGAKKPRKAPMLVAVTEGGYGKRMPIDLFATKGRGGKGMIAIKFKNDEDRLLALTQARGDGEVLLITQKGTLVRQSVNKISGQGRMATGVQLQRLDADDGVASVAVVAPDPDAAAAANYTDAAT